MYYSILGDSISTLQGYNPCGYNVFYEGTNCIRSGVHAYGDTWWGRVIDHFGGELLVNNSWSGSRVSMQPGRGELFPSGCSEERTSGLHKGTTKPDVILLYLGTNDWGVGAGVHKPAYRTIDDDYNMEYFDCAYDRMLEKLTGNYPEAEICCFTLCKSCLAADESVPFPRRIGGTDIEEYVEVIRQMCAKYHCKLIDLWKTQTAYATIDGSHANAQGMKTIAETVIKMM